MVYDLANNEISLAQTDFNATDSNVSEIGTGTASVPDATPVSSAVQAAVSETGGARIELFPARVDHHSQPVRVPAMQFQNRYHMEVSHWLLVLQLRLLVHGPSRKRTFTKHELVKNGIERRYFLHRKH